MTASYLRKMLQRDVDIRLVESDEVNTVGVGEATFSDIHVFLDSLGLREEDWMPECNASYKLAIRFVNWNHERRDFYHPFQRLDAVNGHNMAEWWLKCRKPNGSFHQDCFVVPAMCNAQRSPRFHNGHVFDSKVEDYFLLDSTARAGCLDEKMVQHPYAYHFDAKLFANYLTKYATARGVTRTVDNVERVELSDTGEVAAIHTKKNGRIAGDLFIDCTGFRSLLLGKALNEPFVPFSSNLLCDRAVALQIPSNAERDGIDPFTQATALTSGWVWRIPLYHRTGTGYVYSSAFTTPEAAEMELRHHLGPVSDNCTANHIKMRIGRSRRSWVKNCIAIGLSSGFVEPLESTGIFFIQHSIDRLLSHFPTRQHDEANVAAYNDAINNCIDGIRDFLVLHYVGTTRNDTPFWRATKTNIELPESLKQRLEGWRHRLPNKLTINNNYHGFEAYSYTVMLLGLGVQPENHLPVLNHMDERPAQAMFEKIRKRSDFLCEALPSAYEYLNAMHERRTRANAARAVITNVALSNLAEANLQPALN